MISLTRMNSVVGGRELEEGKGKGKKRRGGRRKEMTQGENETKSLKFVMEKSDGEQVTAQE